MRWVNVGSDYALVDDSERICGLLRIMDDETHQRIIQKAKNDHGVAVSTARIKRYNELRAGYRRNLKKT